MLTPCCSTLIENTHDYATRLAFANAYFIPPVRINDGIFNIRYILDQRYGALLMNL